MVGLLRRFAGRRPVPAPVGRRLFVAPQETLEAAQALFSRLPFDEALPSTALREALPSSATIENGSARSFLERLGRLPYRAVAVWNTWQRGTVVTTSSNTLRSTPAKTKPCLSTF